MLFSATRAALTTRSLSQRIPSTTTLLATRSAQPTQLSTMPKRSRSAAAAPVAEALEPPAKRTPVPLPGSNGLRRKSSARNAARTSTDPDLNDQVIDAPNALRASPDSAVNESLAPTSAKDNGSGAQVSQVAASETAPKKRGRGKKAVASDSIGKPELQTPKTVASDPKNAIENSLSFDPEAEEEQPVDEEEMAKAISRPPPVNSSHLPLPWKGRLGYACLNTYLRNSTPPVFSSRTCRIASIIEHRHPLKDPTQPEHATKNRPDRDQPGDITRGQAWVEKLGLANARDIIKMVRWNERYGIRFMRLSSEMFPFASHEEYGYKLAPFASEALAEAGRVIAELGHRVTTHPGQFTQLGSPRKPVIDNAMRDLEYHDEMLSLLKLPPQQDRDAVMILHMGGTFGDKAATLDRFRENYAKLSPSVKNRLVLENDDVSWTVHDLLPVCQELNIPLVLDFHHHNILFDADKLREGTQDIISLYPEITATWTRKGITQKMHYSEPTPQAITPMQRRKHNPRPFTLPPCADTMDLMIEAKDKEQAVFELMRNFKLPGWNSFNDIIPHVRHDENKPVRAPAAKKKNNKKKPAAKKAAKTEDGDDQLDNVAEQIENAAPPPIVPEDEVGMGGPERRVYWPPGMEEWLRPAKRIVKKKDPEAEIKMTPAKKKAAGAGAAVAAVGADGAAELTPSSGISKRPAPKKVGGARGKKAAAPATPSTSDGDDTAVSDPPELGEDDEAVGPTAATATATQKSGRREQQQQQRTARRSGRAGKARVSYKEEPELSE